MSRLKILTRIKTPRWGNGDLALTCRDASQQVASEQASTLQCAIVPLVCVKWQVTLAKLAWKPGLKGQGAPPKSSLASSDAGAWPELEEVPILSCPYLYVACQCSEACFGGLAGLPSCMTMLAKCSCC